MNLGIIAVLYLIVLVIIFAGSRWLLKLTTTTAAIVAATVGLFVVILGAQQELESKSRIAGFIILSIVASFLFVASFSVIFAERNNQPAVNGS